VDKESRGTNTCKGVGAKKEQQVLAKTMPRRKLEEKDYDTGSSVSCGIGRGYDIVSGVRAPIESYLA
jgi:hypothetical protein